MSKFIRYYFILIIVLILIANISLAESSLVENKEFQKSNFHYNSNSVFSWPLFGYYSISSYFGKRTSPTSRSFNLPFWNWYSRSTWDKYLFNKLSETLYSLDFMVRTDTQLLLKIKIFNFYMLTSLPNLLLK